jgi:hypothetical protein
MRQILPWLCVAAVAACSGDIVVLRINMGIAEDQVTEFESVQNITVTLTGPGGAQSSTFPASPLPAGMRGFPLVSPVDVALEGKAAAGTPLFRGERRQVALPTARELAIVVPIRRLGDFARTLGAPIAARRKHSATLLGDGRVLVAGGEDPATGAPLASAEIFDPETATFVPIGSLGRARAEHAAARLGDGRVVIAGGIAQSDGGIAFPLAIEVFDPAQGRFRDAGAATIERASLTATRYLRDGVEKVLLAGGRGSGAPQGSAEVYDPRTETTAPPTPMNVARSGHAGVEVPGGILLVGGTTATAIGELFQVGNEQFVPTAGPMEAARARAFAAASPQRVIIAGSGDLLESYDPASRRFARVATLPGPRTIVAMAALPGDRFLLAGGGEEGAPVAEAFVLSGTTVAATAGPLDVARVGHSLTGLGDGTALAVGGAGARVAEVYLDAR